MVIGLITFLYGQKFLHGHAEPHDPALLKQRSFGPINKEWAIYLGSILSLAVVWWVVQREPVVHTVQLAMLVVAGLGLVAYSFYKASREDFHRMLVLIVLIASTIVFWSLFEQSASSMTLFADRVMDRTIGDTELKASQFGSLNAGFIILLAPVFAAAWVWLARRRLEPSTPVKFGLGILQAGLGFGALVLGAQFPDESGKVAMIWLILAYLLHTTGELSLSPVGLSAVTKLAVPRVVGAAMGTWFLATALSETLATRMSKWAAVDTAAGEVTDVATALAAYVELFTFLMWFGVGAGLFMIVISPILRRGMHGIH
jgi:POT family proton-dependent oligopeptide transporter